MFEKDSANSGSLRSKDIIQHVSQHAFGGQHTALRVDTEPTRELDSIVEVS